MEKNVLSFNLEEKIVKDLGFEPNPETHNLVICGLDSVQKIMVEVPVETKDGVPSTNEYAGKKVPKLEFIFKTYPAKNTNVRERVLKVIEDVPYTVKNDGTPLKTEDITKAITDKFMRIKHIFDTYAKKANFKPITKLNDIDLESGVDKRIASFDKFFTTFADAFNKGTNDKPIYRPEVGNPYLVWLKVLPDFRTKAWFTIPSFVDTGFIELVEVNPVSKTFFTPNLRIKPNESLVLAPTKKGEKNNAGNDAPDTGGNSAVDDLLAKARG